MSEEEIADIEWNKIARFRDLVSHHYEQVDYEIVYDICKNHLPKLTIMPIFEEKKIRGACVWNA